jgi:hypothetical protein
MSLQTGALLGELTPQILLRPADVHSLDAAREAIELAEAYGVCRGHGLDGSQQFTLEVGLGERLDGSWAAATMCDFEPRQNGKNDSCAARELAGLLLFDERLILHTAHEAKTAKESFERFVAVLEASDDLRRKVKKIRYANGEQGVEMLSGGRLMYATRTASAGRGFAEADLVVYDESQHLTAEQLASSAPTKLANPNSQSWYMGSGGLSHSLAAWRLRKRGLRGVPGRFGYVEHTAEVVSLVEGRVVSVKPADMLDRAAWATANPAYGYRITDEKMLELFEELGPDLFGRECLNLWDPEAGEDAAVWGPGVWASAVSASAAPVRPFFVGVDATPFEPGKGQSCAVAVTGGGVVELVEPRSSMASLEGDVVALARSIGAAVALDPSGPAAFIRPGLEAAGVQMLDVSGQKMGQACGLFFSAVEDRKVQVRQHVDLERAVAGARIMPKADAWVWARKFGLADVSPLVAVTLAWWAASQVVERRKPSFVY